MQNCLNSVLISKYLTKKATKYFKNVQIIQLISRLAAQNTNQNKTSTSRFYRWKKNCGKTMIQQLYGLIFEHKGQMQKIQLFYCFYSNSIIHCKPTFSETIAHFERFLPSISKKLLSWVFTLWIIALICFCIVLRKIVLKKNMIMKPMKPLFLSWIVIITN